MTDAVTPERTLVVWCPDWPLTAAGVGADEPAAVVVANRVVACSAAARREGVVRGLRRREAQGRCPSLTVLAPDPARDARAFEPVVAAVESFSPRVEVTRPGQCALTTRGPSRYFGGDDALAIAIAARVSVVGVGVDVGACSRGAGVTGAVPSGSAAARKQPSSSADGSSDAAGQQVTAAPQVTSARPGREAVPVAGAPPMTDAQPLVGSPRVVGTPSGSGTGTGTGAPPSGIAVRVGIADGLFAAGLAARATTDDDPVRVVPPGQSAAFLAPFSVASLDRPELADLLGRLGIRTLGQFAALPAGDVLARFGSDAAVAHRLARGLDERPVNARTPPPDLAVQRELDPPAARVDIAAFAAKGLADELHRRLSSQGLACTRVLIEAETEHGERLARLWRHDGVLTAAAMAERVRWQLDGWLAGTVDVDTATPTAGLTLLRLVPDEVKPDDGRPMGFWGGAADVDERAIRALARVQGMLGPDAVATGVLSGGRDLAEQVHLVRWGDPRLPLRPGLPGDGPVRVDGRVEVPPWPGRLPPPAPATVHRPPLPAELVDTDGRPVQVTGRGVVLRPPARLRIAAAPDGRWHTVVAWAGPWPVEERWWDPTAHRRRARFQVQDAAGSAYLVVLQRGQWWVEATYD